MYIFSIRFHQFITWHVETCVMKHVSKNTVSLFLNDSIYSHTIPSPHPHTRLPNPPHTPKTIIRQFDKFARVTALCLTPIAHSCTVLRCVTLPRLLPLFFSSSSSSSFFFYFLSFFLPIANKLVSSVLSNSQLKTLCIQPLMQSQNYEQLWCSMNWMNIRGSIKA